MKKRLFFLIAIMTLFLFGTKVNAQEYTFYEAEFLDKMYMSKYEYATGITYYQQARKFRNSQTGIEAYCLEPLIFFNENATYRETTTPRNLTQSQIDRIKKIVYFGFRYKNHYDASWYAVAQLMIWQTSNPTGGDYFFTKTLNGERTNEFDYQINEINHLIDLYDSEIPIKNKTITMIEGETKEISIGEVLKLYHTNNEEIELKDNKIIIKELPAGQYNISLTRETEVMTTRPNTIFESPTSQNMIQIGDLEPKTVSFKINVINNHIDINKVDEDTETCTPTGDANLDGAIYKLYNKDDEEVASVEIENNKGSINNIPFGTYYLKEDTPGTGYTLNDTTYEITLTEANPNKEITVTNKVIEKTITIIKTYDDDNKIEPNIDFQIINSKDELVETVSTDEEGKVTFTLPYGKYTIRQVNTTNGYKLLDPFQIDINNSEDETLELHDYRIPVPNTSTSIKSQILRIIYLLVMILC